jgi:hypothetical protein
MQFDDGYYTDWQERRVARRESVQQATETDWLTRARDFIWAEPYKTLPSSSVAVTYDVGWRAERERDRDTESKQASSD